MSDLVRQIVLDEARAGLPMAEQALREYDALCARLAKIEAELGKQRRARERLHRLNRDFIDQCAKVEAENKRLCVLVDQAEIWMPGVSDTPWRQEAHALGALSAE